MYWVQGVLEKYWRLSLMIHHEVTSNLAEKDPSSTMRAVRLAMKFCFTTAKPRPCSACRAHLSLSPGHSRGCAGGSVCKWAGMGLQWGQWLPLLLAFPRDVNQVPALPNATKLHNLRETTLYKRNSVSLWALSLVQCDSKVNRKGQLRHMTGNMIT